MNTSTPVLLGGFFPFTSTKISPHKFSSIFVEPQTTLHLGLIIVVPTILVPSARKTVCLKFPKEVPSSEALGYSLHSSSDLQRLTTFK